MKIIFICLIFITGSVLAAELEKEIKYLGNDGIEESHQVICLNGLTGIVRINNATQEMTVESDSSTDGVNIGKATFTEAEEIICL